MSELVEEQRAPNGNSGGNSNDKKSWDWGFYLRLAVTLLIFGLLFYFVDVEKVWGEIQKADVPLLVAAVVCFGVFMTLASFRWWFLLKVQNLQLSIPMVIELTMIGHFFNAFLPGSTGGDLIKIYYTVKKTPDNKTKAALSIIVDRAVGLLLLLGGAMVVLPWQMHVLMASEETQFIPYGMATLMVLVLLGIFFLLFTPFHLFPSFIKNFWDKIPERGREIIQKALNAFRDHRRKLPFTLIAFVCGAVGLMIHFAAGWLIAMALGITVGYLQIVVIMAITLCAMAIPASVAGHGIREAGFILMFGLFGVLDVSDPTQEAQAFAFGILYLVVVGIWSVIGGLVYLTFQSKEKKRVTDERQTA